MKNDIPAAAGWIFMQFYPSVFWILSGLNQSECSNVPFQQQLKDFSSIPNASELYCFNVQMGSSTNRDAFKVHSEHSARIWSGFSGFHWAWSDSLKYSWDPTRNLEICQNAIHLAHCPMFLHSECSQKDLNKTFSPKNQVFAMHSERRQNY